MDVKSTIITLVSVTIGAVLVGEMVIPIIESEISALKTAGYTSSAALMGVVITICIISLVLIPVFGFTGGRSGRD